MVQNQHAQPQSNATPRERLPFTESFKHALQPRSVVYQGNRHFVENEGGFEHNFEKSYVPVWLVRDRQKRSKRCFLATPKCNNVPLVDANFQVVTRVKKCKLNPSLALLQNGQNPKGTPFGF